MKFSRLFICLLFAISGCIGTDVIDDFVIAKINIDNPISSLKVDSTYKFMATYLNNVGSPEAAIFMWESSDNNVLQIDDAGIALGLEEGESTVTATAKGISESFILLISDTTIISLNDRVAVLRTSSSYPLTGSVTLKKSGNNIVLELSEDFVTTSALPGLYVYLSNNVNSISNALEVSKITQFSGAQSYEINDEIELNTYSHVLFFCKPFLVAVGDGELKP